jgi:hypothetical protein
MTYSKSEHFCALAVSKMAVDLHEAIGEATVRASNPAVKKAFQEAASALDCWMQDELNNGVLKIIEGMEEEAGIPEYEREQRDIQSYRRE